MIGKFCENVHPSELKDLLQTHAQGVMEGDYYRSLTEDEIELRRACYTENCIKVADLEAGKKEAVEEFKGQIKPLTATNIILLDEIKTRQFKDKGVLYDIANHDDGVMETYNDRGEFIKSRRLRPEERAGGNNIFALPIAK